MEIRAKASIISMILLPIIFITGLLFLLFSPQKEAMRMLSSEFLKEAPELGPGGHLLYPNLKNAKIVTPDRPHDPLEVQADDRFARVKRRRTFEVSTNSMGFRGPEISAKSKEFRILCLGESVTFGWGVTYEESYPALLARELAVEVINAGIPAMRPSHMVKWLKTNVKRLDPDLVLFTARPNWGAPQPLNNFVQALRKAQKQSKPAKVGLILPPISTFDPKGMNSLKSETQKLKADLPNLPTLDLTQIFHSNMPPEGVHMITENGVQMMIDRSNGQIVAQGKSPPQRPGTPALSQNIIDAFEQDKSIHEPLFFDGAHPDKQGFELFARTVADWVKVNGFLDKK